MLTNTEKCLAYNQCKRMVQNYIYNKSIYCKQMHKKDQEEIALQMHLHRTQLWVLGFQIFLFFFMLSLLHTFSAMIRCHCFMNIVFKKTDENENGVLNTIYNILAIQDHILPLY